ncbi:MAG TPA: isochorismatase family protein [Bacteroidales bacterium]|nr:isochorismatase family protein [Bacteroidales bacterium]
MESYNTDYVSVINSILLMLDYQEKKLNEVRSSEKSEIVNAAVSSAKAASILNVPIILTSAGSEYGQYLNELTELFPSKDIIKRTSQNSDALDDERILRLLKKYGRSKLIISGLWTSESLIETAVHAIKEGYDVFGLIDGCGDISHDRHNFGVHRMLKIGVTPITWISLASEWMNGWSDPSENEVPEELFGKYNIMLSYLARH